MRKTRGSHKTTINLFKINKDIIVCIPKQMGVKWNICTEVYGTKNIDVNWGKILVLHLMKPRIFKFLLFVKTDVIVETNKGNPKFINFFYER